MTRSPEPSSFRDPSGFLFRKDGILYRQVHPSYSEDYELLFQSGLYAKLTEAQLLVKHEEAPVPSDASKDCYKILRPELIPFVSYPYEWCFSELKDAALLTLRIQQMALQHGMALKDASGFNVQFLKGKPIFIDTLSFERYQEGTPWVAYKQFCQHFLAPLALMSLVDLQLGRLSLLSMDGVPLSLASRLLPWRTWFKFSLLTHIHLHAKSQQRHASNTNATQSIQKSQMTRMALLGLLDSLEGAIQSFQLPREVTEWGDYYDHTNYTERAGQHKKELVQQYLQRIQPKTVWDLGANDGSYSRLAISQGAQVVSWDIDPIAVEKNYLKLKTELPTQLLPLTLDLTNPTPAIGWAHSERMSLLERGPVDIVMGLALIHHLAISNNVPLPRVMEFLASCGHHVILEFVPKSDSQVKRLLATREDIFPHYNTEGFEAALQEHFQILESTPIQETERTLYLLARKQKAKENAQ